jgi:putative FmdB family regulatory protein
MPLYPFRCPACANEFEVARKMSENTSEAACPACGTAAVRVFVAPTVTGRASESPASEAPPALPGGHGHSHGPGGHTH